MINADLRVFTMMVMESIVLLSHEYLNQLDDASIHPLAHPNPSKLDETVMSIPRECKMK